MRAERGFTLLEVLVAFVIAALALAVMFQAAGFGLDAAHRSGRTEEALTRAKSHLAALGQDSDKLTGSSEGDDGGGYHWRLDIVPRFKDAPQGPDQSGNAVPKIYTVRVTISWRENNRDDAVTLMTVRLGSIPQ